MPFQKGHKFGKGGRRPGAGRPSAETILVEKRAEQIAREFIEEHVNEVLVTYLQNAKVDAPTTRHWIDRFLPPAKIEIGITAEIDDRATLAALMLTKAGRESVEAVTKALTAVKPLPEQTNGNGNKSSHS